ncbi:hypothetical protein PV328_002406 [Microctonus aethiopoides]|uniref:Programmed cell death protein 2 C-terminal domain-containing protein n=1 Tax=Microctonus aethiopoides TaxID=144406 RepID=A0AA39F680_9HYME|nr:hypothetical protein PV328_002406 [Microctonus aethiopoides]
MACKNRSKVYLGYEDEYITEKNRSIVTFATNKIGGKPDLHSNESTLPLISCRLCGLNQLLVVQFWTCLRIQSLEDKSIPETKIQTISPPPTTSWFTGADDWNDDNDDDDSNDNITEPNGNNMSRNKFYKKLNLFMKSMDLDDELNDDLLNLKVDDPNANSPTSIESPIGGGAVGRLDSPQASAEIEGEESEVVCIDTPTKPQYNLMNLLQNVSHLNYPFENSDMKSNVNITFTEIFINVDEEDLTNDITHHVRELSAEYQRSNPDIQIDSSSISTDEKNNEATIEKYEKSLPKHGDKIFHNFLSRIKKNPGQLLRYCRDNTAPLFLYPYGKTNVKACQKCGSERIFEVQLLSTLIPKLKLTPSNEKNFQIEFGTVLVFTCARSCWSAVDLYQEEFVIVQAERL